jgi:ubiquinone/menaquinone biosynthesis C-methylase UbiE
VIRGDGGVTATTVGAYYDQITDIIGDDLGGSFHIGYWAGLPAGSSVRDASRHLTELMIDKLALAPGQRALDIGCGTGRPAVELARAADVEVVGVNISRRQLELAERLAKAEGLDDRVRFEHADAMDLPFEPASFDGVWLFESLLHMPDQLRVLRQAARVLRPGGRLVIANLVQRVPLTDEQNAELQPCWTAGSVAAVVPLQDYPAMVADSGLVLDELVDITEHTARPTFEAIRAEHRARTGDAIEPGIDDGMAKFAVTPEIGFAIVVARKA